jgi:translation initiation factor 3 subunit I
MPFKPILLKGHERPLTKVKYNREGDLLFSCAKDNKPTVWYADNGERLGTYNGHLGTVWDCDINFTSSRLITGSSDRTAKIWDVETGKELFEFKHKAGVRSVGFSLGDHMVFTVQDNQFSQIPTIFIFNLQDDLSQQQDVPVRSLQSSTKISQALWGSLNQTVLASCEDGSIRVWDTETGQELMSAQDHKKSVQSMQFSKDHTMIITASADQTARLYDVKTLKLLKTYHSDRPLNAAALSPIVDHLILGGGQEAMNVTTTAGRAGKFEVDFYHVVYQEWLGSVKGHFGPVNTLAFAPNGKSYASGSEDGYIRLQHFDKTYFQNKDFKSHGEKKEEKAKD